VADVLVTDIGGVVIDRRNGGREPSFFMGDHRMAPEIPGAIYGLAELYGRFGPMMYALSRTFPDFTKKTREWFISHDFHHRTSIGGQRAFFCDKKTAKVEYYVRLHATHIIDDRADNIRHVIDCIARGDALHPNLQLYLFCGNGHSDDPAYGADLPASVHRVRTWHEMVPLILRSEYHQALPT